MLKSSSGDTQHFVESLSFLYSHRFICIMLCLHYSSFRCLHGESRYTTDSTHVGVTLDYVVVINHSLTSTIALSLYFLTLAMVHWCSFLALWLSTTFSTISIVRDELFVLSCPRVLKVLDHPVTFECPCWMMFKGGFLHYCTCGSLFLCA
jgi:hypothetical protein